MHRTANLIFILIAASLLDSFAQSLPNAARIQFASRTNDFGRVIAGEWLKHDFIFTNTGSATLRITDVKVNCGCTTAGEWTHEVKPGATGVIPLQYQTPKLDIATVKGTTVSCNDPQHPAVWLELHAQLWRPVAVEPELVFLTVTNDVITDEVEVVRIVNQEPQPLVLSAPVGNNRLFAAELRTNTPGREYELRIHAVPPLGVSLLSGHFTLRTSSTNQPELRVTAYLQVLSAPAAREPSADWLMGPPVLPLQR